MVEAIIAIVFFASLISFVRYGEGQHSKLKQNISATLCSIALFGAFIMTRNI